MVVLKVQLEQPALKLFLPYILEGSQGPTVCLAMRPDLVDQWEVVRHTGKAWLLESQEYWNCRTQYRADSSVVPGLGL